jgi:adenine/guanine phosphoribosyltransferase-like PRPP-binding protein
MMNQDTNGAAPEALALSALAWTLSEETRAQRLLGTTGLTPEGLRSGLGEPALLAAALRFLEAHEPDLIACAEALGVPPTELVAARRSLES